MGRRSGSSANNDAAPAPQRQLLYDSAFPKGRRLCFASRQNNFIVHPSIGLKKRNLIDGIDMYLPARRHTL